MLVAEAAQEGTMPARAVTPATTVALPPRGVRATPRRGEGPAARRARRSATRLRATLAAAALAVGLPACAPPHPTRFYTLEPAAAPGPTAASPAAAAKGPPVGLGPVDLPAYLDRAEIVTRLGEHQVGMAEFDRWAEPLQGMVAGLLADRLREALGGRGVVRLPARGGAEPGYGVAVAVDRLDADETGRVVLDARWRVYRVGDGRTVRSGRRVAVERGRRRPTTRRWSRPWAGRWATSPGPSPRPSRRGRAEATSPDRAPGVRRSRGSGEE